MKNPAIAAGVAALALLASAPGFSQSQSQQGQGRAIVTVLPKKATQTLPEITLKNLSLKMDGKPATITSWTPLQGPENEVELVLLIDSAARESLGTQMRDITHFVNGLPPNTKAAIAYMFNGSAVFSGPLSADHAQVLKGLHLPGGSPGSSASPYFCLSDLAKRWPSQDRQTRREVLLVTDGVDNYEMRYDPADPYVQAAITDSVRAGMVVYAIYWQSEGRFSRSYYGTNSGQNLLLQLTEATGGTSFWNQQGNPVSFAPFLDDLNRHLQNQYELQFVSRLKGKAEVQDMKLKLDAPGVKVDAPQQVMVYPAAPAAM
jgi:hypothetical protein